MWEGGTSDDQWKKLVEVIAERDPKKIGINISEDWALADGLSVGLHRQLLEYLPETYKSRLVSAESLVVRWLETRSKNELNHPDVCSKWLFMVKSCVAKTKQAAPRTFTRGRLIAPLQPS